MVSHSTTPKACRTVEVCSGMAWSLFSREREHVSFMRSTSGRWRWTIQWNECLVKCGIGRNNPSRPLPRRPCASVVFAWRGRESWCLRGGRNILHMTARYRRHMPLGRAPAEVEARHARAAVLANACPAPRTLGGFERAGEGDSSVQ